MPIIDEEIMVDRTDANVAPASWRGAEIALTRSGSVDLRPSQLGGGAAPGAGDDVTGEIDAATDDYRALFKEFVSLRRTCGESVLNLDRDQFVATLCDTKRRLVERHAAKDVRFRLAFDNGKAAIRYTTVV